MSVLLVRETSGVATFLLLLSILVCYKLRGKHLFLDSWNSKNYLAVCSTSVVSMYSIIMKNAIDMTCLIYLLSKCLKELQERNRSQEWKFKAHKIPSHWFVRFYNMLFSLSSAHLAWCARNAKPGKNHQQNVASDTCHHPNTTWSKSTRAECGFFWDVRDVRESTEGLSLPQILKVRTSPDTSHNRIFELDWELILISLPALPPCFQSLKSETFGKQEAKRNTVLSLRNNDLKKGEKSRRVWNSQHSF